MVLRSRAAAGGGEGALLWIGVFGSLFLPYFAWRWSYYGWPLRNTFYAKVGSSPAQLLRGLAYVNDYLWASGYAILLALAGLPCCRERRVELGVLGSLVVGPSAGATPCTWPARRKATSSSFP